MLPCQKFVLSWCSSPRKGERWPLKKLGGVSQARIMELSQYCLDENAVLLHFPTMAHYYDGGGEPCDESYAKLSPTSVREDRMSAMVVVPKELQHDICYLNHYPKHAAHPRWSNMVIRTREAGATSGIKASCKRLCVTSARCVSRPLAHAVTKEVCSPPGDTVDRLKQSRGTFKS
jgi:hypothetical protein